MQVPFNSSEKRSLKNLAAVCVTKRDKISLSSKLLLRSYFSICYLTVFKLSNFPFKNPT